MVPLPLIAKRFLFINRENTDNYIRFVIIKTYAHFEPSLCSKEEIKRQLRIPHIVFDHVTLNRESIFLPYYLKTVRFIKNYIDVAANAVLHHRSNPLHIHHPIYQQILPFFVARGILS